MLNIPIVAIIDSNSNPDDINYPIPGNDDATRAINTFCELITDTIKSGMNNYSSNASDPGSSENLKEDKKKLDTIEAKLEENNDKKIEMPTAEKEDNITDKGDLNL